MALIAAEAAAEKKAEDILAIDVAGLLVVTDYFVICTGRSDRQVRTIADEVEEVLRERADLKPIGREGHEEGRWVLLDFADVVVHVFQPAERDFYRLEKLWGDAPRLDLSGIEHQKTPNAGGHEPQDVRASEVAMDARE